MNCRLCNQSPEECQCLDELARGREPATIVEGTVSGDIERSSAIWIREDPRHGFPFLTVVLEPMSKSTVDDVRVAIGALVRWRNAIHERTLKPFSEDEALDRVLTLHDQIAGQRGRGTRGVHVELAQVLNRRLACLIQDYIHDVAIKEEARLRIGPEVAAAEPSSAMEDAIRQVVIERCTEGVSQGARYHSLVGLVLATSYLKALGYTSAAAEQICSRAAEDIERGREPFGPEYPCDRRRVREVVRKALRRRVQV